MEQSQRTSLMEQLENLKAYYGGMTVEQLDCAMDSLIATVAQSAPEAAAAEWYECSKCGAGISSKRKGLQRCITGGYCDPKSAAPIAPSADEFTFTNPQGVQVTIDLETAQRNYTRHLIQLNAQDELIDNLADVAKEGRFGMFEFARILKRGDSYSKAFDTIKRLDSALTRPEEYRKGAKNV